MHFRRGVPRIRGGVLMARIHEPDAPVPGPLFSDGSPKLSRDEALRFRALMEHALKEQHVRADGGNAWCYVMGWVKGVIERGASS